MPGVMLDTYKCLKATQFGVNYLQMKNLRAKEIKEHALNFWDSKPFCLIQNPGPFQATHYNALPF